MGALPVNIIASGVQLQAELNGDGAGAAAREAKRREWVAICGQFFVFSVLP